LFNKNLGNLGKSYDSLFADSNSKSKFMRLSVNGHGFHYNSIYAYMHYRPAIFIKACDGAYSPLKDDCYMILQRLDGFQTYK